jgi:uncharacterized protein YjiS (DUF1127 family)
MTQLVLTASEWLNISSFLDLIDDLKRRMELRKLKKETIKELSSLSDKDLSDIGIARSQIKSIAMELDLKDV